MPHVKTFLCALLLLGASVGARAQKEAPLREPDLNKPKLFADLPAALPVSESLLAALLDLPVGKAITVPVSDRFRLEGTVVSRSDAADTCVRSVVLRSSVRGGAAFSLSRVCRPGGGYDWNARMLGYNGGDALELVSENGRYLLVKRGLYDLLSE
ncbi:hypothetical protein [Flaviaesturariibacter amylovorans]|uniref:Uncharacterized protein n=1 Tax=Flaviaesturariibacter amylovorans TaxID=1084520 RepID=A0ABP8G8H7_9BACT